MLLPTPTWGGSPRRLLLTSDLHYKLPHYDWVMNAAPHRPASPTNTASPNGMPPLSTSSANSKQQISPKNTPLMRISLPIVGIAWMFF